VAAADPDEGAPSARSTRIDKLWADVRIDPIEIALPGGVGYTLRAYRSSTEIARPAVTRAADDDADDFDAASAAVARRRRGAPSDDDEDQDTRDDIDDEIDDIDSDDEDLDEDEDEEDDFADDEDEEDVEQEVPVFLGRGGKIFLFHSPDKLVEFVKSGAEHDLSQLDTWGTLVKRVVARDIVPLAEDTYELDLVVENLRGGADVWDPALILRAGELARDLSFALRIDPVLVALSAGTPLDQLDEALRAADGGGVGAIFARRRLKKIPAQQSSLAWRTIISKISGSVQWQD
jgi:hypothetical protein